MNNLRTIVTWLSITALQALPVAAGSDEDSGRSLLPSSELVDLQSGTEALWRVKEEGQGLGPWGAQLAVQREYDRLHLPLLACRYVTATAYLQESDITASRFVSALTAAGRDAGRMASDAVVAARGVLDQLEDAVLAELPSEYGVDAEIAAIQASLDAGQRYPAGDILEARRRRASRAARAGPSAEELAVWKLFRAVTPRLQLVMENVLDQADCLPPAARAVLGKFRKCLVHTLNLPVTERNAGQ